MLSRHSQSERLALLRPLQLCHSSVVFEFSWLSSAAALNYDERAELLDANILQSGGRVMENTFEDSVDG